MSWSTRQLGNSNLRVTPIGLGCVTFGREIDAKTSYAILDRAMEREINLLDTAAVYGDGASEQIIGQWLRDRGLRRRIVIATKVSGALTEGRIRRSVDESLVRLGTDHIDLLQAHDWDDRTPLEETLAAFDSLVRSGKVRFCGCSNWESGQLQRSLSLAAEQGWNRLEAVQPIYHLANRNIEGGLLELCAAQRLGVISYSPLGAGFLTGKYRRGAAVPRGTRFDVKPAHQDAYFTDDGFRCMERLRSLADRTGTSMAALALAWVLSRPGVTSVLVGSRSPRHVDQAFAARELAVDGEILRLFESW